MRRTISSILTVFILLMLVACASMGTPDGGRFDEEPPVMVKAEPREGAVDSWQKKITLFFDEYIRLENASEKVVVSPPQAEVPEIKAVGKKIVVTLADSLRANTTYTVDFADAIIDNNEGNPMGDYAYTFSTGQTIDTLQVSGTVLEASNFEPIKGILVGLYSDLADTAFTSKPFERVSRTDSKGHFVIKGIAPGNYRVYALADVNQNFMFDQQMEKIAFSRDVIVPSSRPDIRPDTTWVDSIHYSSIKLVPFTHYYPDDITLLAFKEDYANRYLKKYVREVPNHFTLVFSTKSDTLPLLKGINFDEKDAFVIDTPMSNDSITYWIRDSLVYNIDTLELALTYMHTDDSLGILVPRTDTLSISPKKTRIALEKERKAAAEEWAKEKKKELKQRRRAELRREEDSSSEALPESEGERLVPADSLAVPSVVTDSIPAHRELSGNDETPSSPDNAKDETGKTKKGKKHKEKDDDDNLEIGTMPEPPLEVKYEFPASIAPNENPFFSFGEPVETIDTAKIHLDMYNTTDSVWVAQDFLLRRNPDDMKKVVLYAEWQPEQEYRIQIDTLAFEGLYVKHSTPAERKFKVKSLEDFSTLFVNLRGADSTFVVQLLNSSEKVISEGRPSRAGRVDFFYIPEGTYYLRGFFDFNGNGLWDTGCYAEDRQAEPVRYYDRSLALKKMWEINQDWFVDALPATRQKPAAIIKQKPDKEKKILNRNAERDRQNAR